MKSKPRQIRDILVYAQKNNLAVNPRAGYSYFVSNIMDCGSCPCRPERRSCPCPESHDEIKTDGHCTCGLFYKDFRAFLENEFPDIIRRII